MALKIVSSRCPTCGANLSVPPGVSEVTCRYCQNVIHVEHRRPPTEASASEALAPSQTLYLDPDASKSSSTIGVVLVLGVVVLPILIPILIFAGPWALRSCKALVKPFPAACDDNEELELSGNFESTGPLFTSVGNNCKIHIKNAKLKAATMFQSTASNVEITLEGVTLETTDVLLKPGVNTKLKIHDSTLVSAVNVLHADHNLEVSEIVKSTLESKSGVAIKAQANAKVNLDNGKLRGKKGGVETDSGLHLTMKNGSEITSDGIAIKTSSGFVFEADGGKIDGREGAIITSSGASMTCRGLLVSSKEKALVTTSSLKLDFTDGAITSLGDVAIETDSGSELVLVSTKVQAATNAITGTSNVKVKASKKTRITSTSGNGFVGTSSLDLAFIDAALEAGGKGIKGTSSVKIKLAQGARVTGRKGAIETEGNLSLESTASVLEGGTGPGLSVGYGSSVALHQGSVKGTPALFFNGKADNIELDGVKIEGEQRGVSR